MGVAKDHGSYKLYDLSGDKYECGDDERCPVCGTSLTDGYNDLTFCDGVIQVLYHCGGCGHTLTFNYFLDNVIAE